MCAFRFQRFSLYLTLYAFALCEIYQAFAVVCKKNLYKIFFKVVFRPFLPGLLATLQSVKREHFASFLAMSERTAL